MQEKKPHQNNPPTLRVKALPGLLAHCVVHPVQKFYEPLEFPKPLDKGQNKKVSAFKEGRGFGAAIRAHVEVGTRINQGSGKQISCLEDKTI